MWVFQGVEANIHQVLRAHYGIFAHIAYSWGSSKNDIHMDPYIQYFLCVCDVQIHSWTQGEDMRVLNIYHKKHTWGGEYHSGMVTRVFGRYGYWRNGFLDVV